VSSSVSGSLFFEHTPNRALRNPGVILGHKTDIVLICQALVLTTVLSFAERTGVCKAFFR
jgi:hypothetical protein